MSEGTNLRKMLENFPETFEPLCGGSKKAPQDSRQISQNISLQLKSRITEELLQERREKSFGAGVIFQEPKKTKPKNHTDSAK